MTFVRWGRKKLTVLALGALGLAGALTLAAFAAPDHAAFASETYKPGRADEVVAKVPARDPSEVAARRQLASSPERVELAVELARADIQRYRTLSDPRYLGRAQATLARWWKLPDPPPEVLLLRATIEQSIHEFPQARADLDKLVAQNPDDSQAQITRAVVATITADYAAARASCNAVAARAGALVAATCTAPLDGIAGKPDVAYAHLREVLMRSPRANAEIRGWALTALAELAYQLDDTESAMRSLRSALDLDADDAYARNLLADILMVTGHNDEAVKLLAGRDTIDSHLVRLAIASRDAKYVQAMRDRIAAAAERGDRIHLREEARFALAVDGDAPRAARIARDNWAVQKELADARLLAECAAAANDRDAAEPVISWARATGVRDAQLATFFTKLGVGGAR